VFHHTGSLPFSRPAASANSICGGCEAAIVGVAIGIGAGIGVGIYLIHRGHTSLTGCVRQTGGGFSLIAKDSNIYELMNAPSEVKALERLFLRGHRIKSRSGMLFKWTTSPEITVRAAHEPKLDVTNDRSARRCGVTSAPSSSAICLANSVTVMGFQPSCSFPIPWNVKTCQQLERTHLH
jgi:hypothetical protein